MRQLPNRQVLQSYETAENFELLVVEPVPELVLDGAVLTGALAELGR